MTKINPIFEAIGNIDDEIAANAVKSAERRKHKKPLKIILIAAAAAALALIVGFASGAVSVSDHKFSFGIGNSANRSFYFNLTSQEFTIPDEFMSKLEYGIYQDYVETPPSELFKMFGITPLMNENFTDSDSMKPRVDILYTDNDFQIIDFVYYLYDKSLDKDILFKAEYVSNIANYTSESSYQFEKENEPNVITLKDGSLCLVTNYMAVFSYNGVRYELIFDEPDNLTGVETVTQALIDLGVYA